jgi:predicted permease
MSARDDRDLDDEIRFHLEEEARIRMRDGMTADDAVTTARRDFGNLLHVKEATRPVWTWTSLETLGQDLRFAGRILRRHKVFTLFSIVSLALGIGATSAIFSLFNAIVLRQLPVPNPERLVSLSFAMGTGRPNNYNNYMPYPHFAAMRDSNSTLDGLCAWTTTLRASFTIGNQTEIVSTALVSGDYHRTLGLRPAVGRLLTVEDDQPGAATAVISYGYWQRRFGGDASIVGSGITLNQLPFTIVGVEPEGFAGVNLEFAPDVTVPLQSRDRATGKRGGAWDNPFITWIEIMGRMRSEVTLDQTRQDLSRIYAQVNATAGQTAPAGSFDARMAREAHLNVDPGGRGGVSNLRNGYERWLRLLLMMLGSVVLLASLNVATLLLSRADARRDEIATRLAIGAGRWRIVRQLMTEAAVISLGGAGLGLVIAWWGSDVLLRMAMPNAERLPLDPTPDVRVIGFTIAMCVATCVLFGLMPALRTTASARVSTRDTGGRQRRRLERSLVAAQTAVSLVLLVFAVLFVRSLGHLWGRDPGYERNQVVMFSADAALAGKKNLDGINTYQALLDALKTLPGAQSVSASAVGPISNTYYFVGSVTKAGDNDFSGDRRIRIAWNRTSPGYFSTMGIPLVAGRDFDARDGAQAPKVAIVSEVLARKFTGNPVGQLLGGLDGGDCEVVGVAKDSRYANIKDAPRDVVYLPMFQATNIGYTPTFEVRHAGSAANVLNALRDVVKRVDPALTIFQPKTLEQYTRDSLSQERMLAILSTYVGGFALLLACIGLYGLMMYTVTHRTHELGLRMALGSQPAWIRGLVLKDSAVTVIAGAVLGLSASVALVRVVDARLFGLTATDPAAIGTATLILLAVACLAAYLPARRASRINPIVALREL